jgi:hypothetical protein
VSDAEGADKGAVDAIVSESAGTTSGGGGGDTDAEEPITVVEFGDGSVGVGVFRLGKLVCLSLSELEWPHRIGEAVTEGGYWERVRLTFSTVRSVDVVLRQLCALRRHLAHQCGGCGDPLETCGDYCPRCLDLWALRLAEPGSRVMAGIEFLRARDLSIAASRGVWTAEVGRG